MLDQREGEKMLRKAVEWFFIGTMWCLLIGGIGGGVLFLLAAPILAGLDEGWNVGLPLAGVVYGIPVFILGFLWANASKNARENPRPEVCRCGHHKKHHWGEGTKCRASVRSGETELGITIWGECGNCTHYQQTERGLRTIRRYGYEDRPL